MMSYNLPLRNITVLTPEEKANMEANCIKVAESLLAGEDSKIKIQAASKDNVDVNIIIPTHSNRLPPEYEWLQKTLKKLDHLIKALNTGKKYWLILEDINKNEINRRLDEIADIRHKAYN
jgi:phosphoribosylformylglycinamidine (FGAM) synthase PurS component